MFFSFVGVQFFVLMGKRQAKKQPGPDAKKQCLVGRITTTAGKANQKIRDNFMSLSNEEQYVNCNPEDGKTLFQRLSDDIDRKEKKIPPLPRFGLHYNNELRRMYASENSIFKMLKAPDDDTSVAPEALKKACFGVGWEVGWVATQPPTHHPPTYPPTHTPTDPWQAMVDAKKQKPARGGLMSWMASSTMASLRTALGIWRWQCGLRLADTTTQLPCAISIIEWTARFKLKSDVPYHYLLLLSCNCLLPLPIAYYLLHIGTAYGHCLLPLPIVTC